MGNEDFKHRCILDNFIVPWLGNSSAVNRLELRNLEQEKEFYSLLLFPPLKWSELLLRSWVDSIFLHVPSSFRLRITGIMKHLRNPQR